MKQLRSWAQAGKATGRVAVATVEALQMLHLTECHEAQGDADALSALPFRCFPFRALSKALCLHGHGDALWKNYEAERNKKFRESKLCRACNSVQGALFKGRTLALSRAMLPEARLVVKMLHWPGLHPTLRRGLCRTSGEGISKPS